MIQILLWSQNGEITQTQDLNVVQEALLDKTRRFWVDIDTPSENDLMFLEKMFHFHPMTIEAVRDPVGVPKMDLHEDYIFLVLHRIFYDFKSEKCELREFEVYFSDQFIVTTHQTHLSRTFQVTREQVSQHSTELGQHGSSFVLFRLLSMAIEDYKPAIESWQDTLDDVEQRVFKSTGDQILEKILEFKKLVTRMRRSLLPEREILIELCENKDVSFLVKGTRSYFKIALDSMNLLLQEFEGLRDHTSFVFDIYATMLNTRVAESSNQLNYIMQRLTIAASIFLPLTFIVGVYGMNFEFMPELKWKWAYFLIWAIMITITVGMVYFFRRKKWL